ncbi:MAG: hypothetical protein WC505_05800 [Patescibacteria group bacterium]
MTQFVHVDSRNPKSKPIYRNSQGEYIPLNDDAADAINRRNEAVAAQNKVEVEPTHEMNPTPKNMPVQGATFERGTAALAASRKETEELQQLLDGVREDYADLLAKYAALENAPMVRTSYVVIAEVASVSRDGDIATIKAKAAWGNERSDITIELPASAVREAVAKKPAKPVARKNAKAAPAAE